MTKVGVFSPENARIVLDVVRYLRESGFVIQPPGRGSQLIPPATPIFFRNDSGEAVPPFACMQTTGTVESGGQNYITIDKPADTDGSAGWYLFNGIAEVEIDGYGVAHDGPLVRMLTDGSAVSSGDKLQPQVSAWEVEPGGSQFTAVGADDIETDVIRGFSLGSGAVTLTVVTDIRVSGTTFQYKTRSITVSSAGTESAWTTWHTGTACP